MLSEDDGDAILNGWLVRFMTGDPRATTANLIKALTEDYAQEGISDGYAHSGIIRDQGGFAVTPNGDRLNDLRSKVAGWHFSKEALTEGERDILYVAEQFLAELDRIAGGYLR